MSLVSADSVFDGRLEPLIRDIAVVLPLTVLSLAHKTQRPASGLIQYALLVVVTATPLDEAVECLQQCKTPESARGRLLLYAAERSFREVGEHNGPNYAGDRTDTEEEASPHA